MITLLRNNIHLEATAWLGMRVMSGRGTPRRALIQIHSPAEFLPL